VGIFNKDLKIGIGDKYDMYYVSTEGITAEEIATIKAKEAKLINIYQKFDLNNDGSLDQIELAKTMDSFNKEIYDKELTNDELENYATSFNQTHNLTGDDALEAKDFRNFIKSIRNFTKNDNKTFVNDILTADRLLTDATEQGLTKVEGNYTIQGFDEIFDVSEEIPQIYEQNGKYLLAIIQDDNSIQYGRIKKIDENTFQYKTQEEVDEEFFNEAIASFDEWNEEHNYYIKTNTPGIYQDADNPNHLTRVEAGGNWYRVKLENGAYVKKSDEEIATETREEEAERIRLDLATPKDYTVQEGETITQILTKSLEAQNIEVNKENLADALEKFRENNPNAIHKTSSGYEYLYAGATVKISGNLTNLQNGELINTRIWARNDAQKRNFTKVEGHDAYQDDTGTYYIWNPNYECLTPAKVLNGQLERMSIREIVTNCGYVVETTNDPTSFLIEGMLYKYNPQKNALYTSREEIIEIVQAKYPGLTYVEIDTDNKYYSNVPTDCHVFQDETGENYYVTYKSLTARNNGLKVDWFTTPKAVYTTLITLPEGPGLIQVN